MDKTLKILVAGAAIAAGLAAFCAVTNYVNTTRHEQKIASLESTIAALQAKCASRARKARSQVKDGGTIRSSVTQTNYPLMQTARSSVYKRTCRKSRMKFT